MSMFNDADITIEIKLKNNAIIRTKMHVGGNKMWPMGENSDSPVSPTIEEINSGDVLLQYIYKSYFPYSPARWSEDEDVWFDSEDYRLNGYQKGYEKILSIEDFRAVKEITIKERFQWEEGGSTTQQLLINGENCPFIDTLSIFSESELQSKKPTLPSSITFIGKNAFLGCDSLNIFVEENTPAHLCLEKHGMPHYVINKSALSLATCSETKKRLHCQEALPDYYGFDYDTLRIITAGDIYVLLVQYPEELPVENKPNVWLDPDDYMPEIVDGQLTWGDLEIKSVVELSTALFFVLSDKIDFEMLKTYLSYSTNKITSNDAVETFLNCHKSEYLNAFEKGSFDAIKNLNLSSMNETQKKAAVLNAVEEKFKSILPNFEELISPFIEVCSNVDKISDILFVETSHGIIGENELEDEELWESNFKLDFSLLN